MTTEKAQRTIIVYWAFFFEVDFCEKFQKLQMEIEDVLAWSISRTSSFI